MKNNIDFMEVQVGNFVQKREQNTWDVNGGIQLYE